MELELGHVSDRDLQQILDNIPGLVATMSAAGEVEYCNRPTLEYFGKTNEELKDWSLNGAVHPDDLPQIIAARATALETGHVYEIEHRCRRADGVYRWFHVRGQPVRNTSGAITIWYLLLTDIEERKQAERAQQSQERNLYLLVNTISAFIQVLRPDGTVLYANRASLDYWGVTHEDTQQADFRARIFHPEDVARLREERQQALARPLPFQMEQRVRGHDGSYRWF